MLARRLYHIYIGIVVITYAQLTPPPHHRRAAGFFGAYRARARARSYPACSQGSCACPRRSPCRRRPPPSPYPLTQPLTARSSACARVVAAAARRRHNLLELRRTRRVTAAAAAMRATQSVRGLRRIWGAAGACPRPCAQPWLSGRLAPS